MYIYIYVYMYICIYIYVYVVYTHNTFKDPFQDQGSRSAGGFRGLVLQLGLLGAEVRTRDMGRSWHITAYFAMKHMGKWTISPLDSKICYGNMVSCGISLKWYNPDMLTYPDDFKIWKGILEPWHPKNQHHISHQKQRSDFSYRISVVNISITNLHLISSNIIWYHLTSSNII